jgi:tRNA-specific 2-thiouridylase
LARKKKVFVGLSGGVDSSVSAFLLKKRGYDVTGIHIKGYNVDGCAEEDAIMARRSAGWLGIPFYVWDMEKEYKEEVVNYMVSAYESGITPNPDVVCNKEIKFGLFYKRARLLGADFIATGHYARIGKKGSIILSAKDSSKDQTYFLWAIRKEALARTLFPLGNLLKSKVRKIAIKAGLPNATRKDSQGVCFLGKLKMADFLSQYIKEDPGPINSVKGELLGTHKGLQFYTLGQRHLGIKNMGASESLYVAKKDKEKNALILAPENHPLLFVKKIYLKDINIFSSELTLSEKGKDILVRVRYRQPLFKASLKISKGDKGVVIFQEPCQFVAPGQSAVFYSSSGKEMLGGGVII